MAEKKKWRKVPGTEPEDTTTGDFGGGDGRPPRIVMTPDPDDEGDEPDAASSGSAIAMGPGTLGDDIEAVRLESERERLAAANALRDWVAVEKPSNEPILKRLESDIRSGRKLNEWGAFSLDDLLRPPAYDHSRHWAARVGNIVTLVRNVLLFAPVGLTWYAIDHAAGAYQETLVKNPASTDTFLQVWGNESWNLERVAFWDMIIIVCLIALTFAAHMLEGSAEAVARRREDSADARFREVMVNVGLYLHGFRQITPAALGGGLADSVNQLVIATTAMKEASESMELITAKGSVTLAEFAELSAKEFAPASERLAQLAETLEAAAGTHRDLSELVKTLHGHLEGSIGTMDARMRTLITELVTQMKENVDSVAVSTMEVGDRIDRIGGHLQAASATTLAAVEALYRHWRDGEGGRGIPRA
jgi:hypothetical protein